MTQSSNCNGKIIIANLLAYALLTMQVAPMAMASNRPGVGNAPAKNAETSRLRPEAEAVLANIDWGNPFAPVPVPLNAPAILAPNLTATKVDTYPSAPGGAQPGEIITYSVTVTNSGPDPATNVTLSDTVDVNTTIVGAPKSTPIGFDDAFSVVGNVRIQVPDGASDLLANDLDPDTDTNAGLTITTLAGDASAPFAGTSTNVGQVTATTGDGSFQYRPAPGFSGTDTFTYTVTDSDGGTSTPTVTLTVSSPVWFVNSSAPVGGDGRITAPFNCYTGANSGIQTCFSATAADDPGDMIFLFNGNYIGGNTLLNNQRLVGQGATDTLANIGGVSVPAFSDPLPSTGGAKPTITTAAAATNGVPLGQGNYLRGFTVGNTTGAKISGNNFGTLTVGNNASPDMILNGAGRALSLTNGTFAATSAFSSVTTSSGTQGISLTTVAGTVAFGSTTVSGSTTQGILVTTSTADISFGNTSVSGGTVGVSLQNNSAGTRTFGTLSISNNSGIGFLHSVGGGNVNVTGATSIPAAAQTAPVGTGIDIRSLASGTTVTFAATTVSKGNAGTGVNLGTAATGNTGNVTFNSLAITTANGSGLVATGNIGQVNVTTNAGSISSTNGPGINITKAAAPATPISLNFSTVSSTNSTANGINLGRVSGNMTLATTNVINSTGIGIQIQNTSAGGTMTFGNTTANQSGSTGVFMNTNAGGVTFGDLDISPDSGQRALQSTNSTGSITSTSGDVTATSNVTLQINGLSAASRTPLAMVLSNLDSTNSLGIGVDLNFVSGNLTVNDATLATNISNPTGIGIRVQNTAAGGTMNFGNTNVSASGGTGVSLVANAGGVAFGDLDISPDSGQRALQSTSSSGTITSTSGDVTATSNVTLQINGLNAASRTPLAMVLSNLDSINSTSLGVDLNFVSGNLTVNDPTLASNISNPTGIGIRVRNTAAGGTMNFGNTNVSASGGTGVFLSINAGGVTFADVDITPDSPQRAFQATLNTGTLTSTSGAIDAPNATAVEIVGTSAAVRTPLNMTLTSISSTGGTTAGIILTSTSATGSPGGFTVVGDGGVANNGSGGTISGKVGVTNGVDGVTLTSADNISLNYLNINTNNRNGILGTSVNGFRLNRCNLASNANQINPNESNVRLANLSGSALAGPNPTSITNTSIINGFENNLEVVNGAGITLTDLQIANSTISNNGASGVATNMISVVVSGGATTTVTLADSTMVGNRIAGALTTAGLQASVSAGTLNVNVLRNTLQNHTTAVDLSASLSGALNFDITDNGGSAGVANNGAVNGIITGSNATAVSVLSQGTATGSMNGFIRGNTIGTQGVTSSGSRVGRGLQILNQGSVQTTVLISGNIVQEIGVMGTSGTEGIMVQHGLAGVSAAEPSSVTNINNIIRDVRNSRAIVHQIINTGSLCSDIGGQGVVGSDKNILTNIFGQGGGASKLQVNRTNGTHNIRQLTPTAALNPLELDDANNLSLAAVTISGVNNFNTVACTQPSSFAPVTFNDAIREPGSVPGEIPKGEPVRQTAARITDSVTPLFISSVPGTTEALVTTPAKLATQTAIVRRPVESAANDDQRQTAPPIPASSPRANQPVVGLGGNSLTWNVGTLPAGRSITITFTVQVENPYSGPPQVSNQGTVTFGGGGGPLLTDDPSVGGLSDPTVTPIALPPDVFIRDARVAEPTSGTTSMLFTVALSTPATQVTTINYTTADGSAVTPGDYIAVASSTITFMTGEQLKTIPITVNSDVDNTELDEDFTVSVTANPTEALIVDGTATGTITVANPPGTILISELRTSGPGGVGDDFVEIYNNTDTPLTVPAGGYGLFKRGADCNALPELVGTIPEATVIPSRGHYLFVGTTYSLVDYGGTGAALGNQTLTTDIEIDRHVALFSTVDPLSISTSNRLDAVGFGGSTGGVCDLLLEGTTLLPASGSTSEYSFVREFILVGIDVPTPTDGNDNAADFTVISTTPSTPVGSNAAPTLGSPGPENLAGPNLKKYSQVGVQLIDSMLSASVAPNRERDTTPDPANNSTLGTLASRRTFTNNTGVPITHLRFRIYDITTFPAPVGTADLRVRTSSDVVVTITGGGMATALATTLETPPTQALSGGLNSSLAAGTVTMGTPLAPGASININFLFGVQQSGSFRVFVFVEAVP